MQKNRNDIRQIIGLMLIDASYYIILVAKLFSINQRDLSFSFVSDGSNINCIYVFLAYLWLRWGDIKILPMYISRWFN